MYADGSTHLLDPTVTGGGANTIQAEMTDLDLFEFGWRGVPVDIDGLAEVDVGREDTDFLDLKESSAGADAIGTSVTVGRAVLSFLF